MNLKKTTNLKDYILIGVLSSINILIMMIVGIITAVLGPACNALFHSAVGGLMSGTIILILAKKTNVKWLFTIVYTITLLVFKLIGMGYLPWQLATIISAIFADIISMKKKYKDIKLLAISHGLTITGQAVGKVIPILLFANKFKRDFLAKGVEQSYIEGLISFLKGPMSITVILMSFTFGVLGIYLGKNILKKHFEKAGIV
ncbi:MAG: MptD family putative ECF transporter S component [Spirochaetales bacterium]|nr:MptD family putative ECF transporter S component [Fusobacteriaceae bacterium]MBN2617459.1 MptD family putative ECF transporter S component [Spirochaetales bacterium]